MYRVARNHCLNLVRSRKRRRDRYPVQSQLDLADSLTGHLTRLERAEVHEQVLKALSGLSESHQEILRLRYTEGLSRQEIAEVVEVPLSTVKSRLFEGLKQLRLDTAGNSRD